MIPTLLATLGFLWVVALPGGLAAHAILPSGSHAERLFVGLTLGFAVMPVLSFAAAMALGTIVRPALVLGVATLVNAALAVTISWRRRAAERG